MKKRFLTAGLVILTLSLLMLGACDKTTTATGTTTKTNTSYAAGQGRIQVYVTDAPAQGISSIVIQASSVEVHRAGDNEGEWITLLENPPSFDLFDVVGIQSLLGSANIASGEYTQVRMSITSVTVTIAGEESMAEVPSDKLKFVGNITVTEGKTTSVSIDFDAEKSIVVKGNGDVSLKPVVKLLISKPGGTLEDPDIVTITPSEPL
jgi:hypothetical protein